MKVSLNGLDLLANIPLQHRPCLGEKILLSVKLLPHSRDLKVLAHEMGVEALYVCPSASAADDTRELLGESYKVVTISKFISDLLDRSQCEQKVVRKSELMLELATIWKKYDPERSVELFTQSFNLFTELRSFSLQKELFEDVLNNLDSRLNYSIQIFWAYCETLDIVDEHRAYGLLSQWLQAEDDLGEKDFESIVFQGFSHLNGNQVDFIKNLALRTSVSLVFPKAAYLESTNQDYIHWFDFENPHQDLVEEVEQTQTSKSKLKVYRFPQGRLNEALKVLDQQGQNMSSTDFVLMTKSLDKRFVLDIPFGTHFYKSKAGIFEQDLHAISELVTQKFSQLDQACDSNEVMDFLQGQLEAELSVGFENKNFRKIKLWGELIHLLEGYIEKSSLNETIELYDLRILLEVLRLNTPRVYTVALNNEQEKTRPTIKGIEGLVRTQQDRPLFICAQSEYPPLKSGRSSFDQDSLKILSGIGPLQRGDLELSLLKCRLQECLEQEQSTLLLERGLDESDPSWDEILGQYEVELTDIIPIQKTRAKDYFAKAKQEVQFESLSATKLQSYLDCPRKFYYQYVEKLSHREDLSTELRADQLGVLEHKVIEEYAKNEEGWNAETHYEYVKKWLDQLIQKEDKNISQTRYGEYFNEVKVFTENGLKVFYNLYKIWPDLSYAFELNIKKEQDGVEKRGSVDLFIETVDGMGVIDFKRSLGSIPGQKSVLNFEKIQLWFYLKAMNIDSDSLMFTGFYNLGEPETSVFMVKDKEGKELMSELGVKSFVAKDLPGLMEEYNVFEQEKFSEMQKEREFPPRPLKADVCRYCDLNNVCPRG